MAEQKKRTLYIIAGCNGAGKTTASFTVLPEMLDCREFVNADEIAKGLSPFNPEGVAIQAGRLMIDRIIHLLKEGDTSAPTSSSSSRLSDAAILSPCSSSRSPRPNRRWPGWPSV